MMIKRIEDTTRVLGKSQGHLGLPIRDEVANCNVGGPGTPCMVTAWKPTPDELARLNAGAPVLLRIIGTGHPPVSVEVGDVPFPSTFPALPSLAHSRSSIILC